MWQVLKRVNRSGFWRGELNSRYRVCGFRCCRNRLGCRHEFWVLEVCFRTASPCFLTPRRIRLAHHIYLR